MIVVTSMLVILLLKLLILRCCSVPSRCMSSFVHDSLIIMYLCPIATLEKIIAVKYLAWCIEGIFHLLFEFRSIWCSAHLVMRYYFDQITITHHDSHMQHPLWICTLANLYQRIQRELGSNINNPWQCGNRQNSILHIRYLSNDASRFISICLSSLQ
jgi:hypothetical protein